MPAATILTIAALALLPALYLHDTVKEKRERGTFFEAATPLFESYRVTQEGKNFPILEGRYRGHAVRLEPVLDTMTARKLPSLWLKVTVMKPNPHRTSFSYLVRPDGNEFYSPSSDMPRRLAIPANWPQNATLCTDNMETDPDYDLLDSEIEILFQDPRAKEVVASPHGVRIVYQAAQGDRAHYLVLRQARFDKPFADPALVRSLLDRALGIAVSLDQAGCEDYALRPVAA